MAFSGTVSQTTLNTQTVIDRAFGRCRIKPEMISAEYIKVAQDNLYLLLSDLANQGAPLWCVEKQIYPLYNGVSAVALEAGTVDILNANLRFLQEVTGTNTDAATYRVIQFASATIVSTVGILWDGASAPLAFARSDDGVTWETIQTETPTASAGQWSWYDLDSAVAATYFRVLATSGTLDFSDIHTGNTPSEIPLGRLNRDDYTYLPNKTFTSSRPLQYWFDRQITQPVMRLWPVPNAAAETSQIVLWRHRYIMDVGTLVQEIEVPQRWYQAIVSLLALRLAYEIAEVDPNLILPLKSVADEDLSKAQAEERDNSPFNVMPQISAYTR